MKIAFTSMILSSHNTGYQWWKVESYIDSLIARYAVPRTSYIGSSHQSTEARLCIASYVLVRDPVTSVGHYSRYRRRLIRHPLATQVLHPSLRIDSSPDRLFCGLRSDQCCYPCSTGALLWATCGPGMALLRIHGRYRYLLPEQYQHTRGDQRSRGLAIDNHRLPTLGQRRCVALCSTHSSSATSGYGSTLLLDLSINAISWCFLGVVAV